MKIIIVPKPRRRFLENRHYW